MEKELFKNSTFTFTLDAEESKIKITDRYDNSVVVDLHRYQENRAKKILSVADIRGMVKHGAETLLLTWDWQKEIMPNRESLLEVKRFLESMQIK